MQNKLVPAILIGGTIGAIIALADKTLANRYQTKCKTLKKATLQENLLN